MSNELATTCTSKLACMKGKMVKLTSKGGMMVKQHSPEILTVLGVGGLIFATYKFVKAQTKAEEILDQHKAKMTAIEQAKEYDEYTPADAQQDTVVSYFQTGRDFVFLYGPIVMLGAGSIAAIFGAQKILRKRNVALAAAYKVIDKAFAEYRGRVVEELGAEKDFHFRHGTKFKTVTEERTDEDGKTVTSKRKAQVVEDGFSPSGYSRMFTKQVYDTEGGYTGSSQWSEKHGDYNAFTLVNKCNWANDHLRAHGYLFLNDVYRELGFQPTKAGQIVGWKLDGNGDGYVSFGPEVDALIDKTAGFMAYKPGQSFLLDFNVDGPILDAVDEI